VSAVTSHSIHKLEIEDYAHVTLRTPSGVVFLNEASYTFPGNGSDQERKISGEEGIPSGDHDRRGRADQRTGPQRDHHGAGRYLSGWPRVVNECLESIGRGESAAGDGARLRSCRVTGVRCVPDGGEA